MNHYFGKYSSIVVLPLQIRSCGSELRRPDELLSCSIPRTFTTVKAKTVESKTIASRLFVMNTGKPNGIQSDLTSITHLRA